MISASTAWSSTAPSRSACSGGFELRVGGNAALIRDQPALVEREARPEEVLLRQRRLRTDDEYDLSIGLGYTV